MSETPEPRYCAPGDGVEGGYIQTTDLLPNYSGQAMAFQSEIGGMIHYSFAEAEMERMHKEIARKLLSVRNGRPNE